ncbi:C-type lectin domain family 4 member A-like isoform X4 [Cricetulus griseus]|uniref:C-type lectin domain family 4 member A-like isoform X4 n=1 Tax=Cricetulus griseus TaxID=10029 RepID=A0A9J7H5D7_CRIGR|nr:C-type lectin domain family 4 member A-like isoform X4 [Cricetulus griseus]
MASEITYAEVKFKNESNSPGTDSNSAAAPKVKPAPHLSKPGGPSLLFTSLMALFLLLAISFLVAFIYKVWSCCPKDWKAFSSHCYFISNDLANWNQSEEKCSSMGAHLMVVHSKEEQDFITKFLSDRDAYFIGLLDPGQRQWRWVDQTPYNESATFWHPGEPNNDKEQCVIVNHRLSGWGWNDIPCSDTQKSVCQMKKIYL